MKRTAYLLAIGLAFALAPSCRSVASAPATVKPVDAPEPKQAPVATAQSVALFEFNQYADRYESGHFVVAHVTICSLTDRAQFVLVTVNPILPGRFITHNTYADDHPASVTGFINQPDQKNESGNLTTPSIIPLLTYISYIDNRQRLRLKAPGEYQASTFLPSILNKRRYRFYPC